MQIQVLQHYQIINTQTSVPVHLPRVPVSKGSFAELEPWNQRYLYSVLILQTSVLVLLRSSKNSRALPGNLIAEYQYPKLQ